MTPIIYKIFEEICSSAHLHGPILEVGAIPGDDCLLNIPCLQQATQRIGVNLNATISQPGYEIIQGNSNHMPNFADNYFEAVLCNATLEHDRYFWRTVHEIHRVTAPCGLIIIGVPGFAGMGADSFADGRPVLGWMLRLLAKLTRSDLLQAGTVILGEHNYPGDYYRFTEQAMRQVFLEELEDIHIRKVMMPPRLIGWGRKPSALI